MDRVLLHEEPLERFMSEQSGIDIFVVAANMSAAPNNDLINATNMQTCSKKCHFYDHLERHPEKHFEKRMVKWKLVKWTSNQRLRPSS